jgi:hypothetical protein
MEHGELLEGFIKLVSYFIEASRNLLFVFSSQKGSQNCKTISHHTKSIDEILGPAKYIHRLTLFL